MFRATRSLLKNMGIQKTIIKEGTGPIPVKGQTVTIEYTGWLKDTTKPDNKGEQYVNPEQDNHLPASSSDCIQARAQILI